MLCFRYKKLLFPFSEGTLDEKTGARVACHVEKCPACKADLARINSVASTLRETEFPIANPSPELWANVRQQIQTSPESRPLARTSRPAKLAYAFAAVLVMGVIGWSTLIPGTSPERAEMAQSPSSALNSRSPRKAYVQKQRGDDAPQVVDQSLVTTKSAAGESATQQTGSKPHSKVPSFSGEKTRGERVAMAEPPQMGLAHESLPTRPNPASSILQRASEEATSLNESSGAALANKGTYTGASPPSHDGTRRESVASAGAPVEKARPGDSFADANRAASTFKETPISSPESAKESDRDRGPGEGYHSSLPNHAKRKDKHLSPKGRDTAARAKTAGPSADEYVDIARKQMAAGQKAEAAANFVRAFEVADSTRWCEIQRELAEAGAVALVKEYVARSFAASGSVKKGEILYVLQSGENDASGMVATARKLVELDPDQGRFWLKLGEAYEAAGETAKALAAYRKAASDSDRSVAAAAKAKAEALSKKLKP